VHPLTRRNPGNNVGVFAPNIDYRFEPEGDWIDITAVHKGGLFGSDYRMLFPGDGIGECTRVCPKGLDPSLAIRRLKRRALLGAMS
jgi:L(+)-tartrate dehydratase alpha subunit